MSNTAGAPSSGINLDFIYLSSGTVRSEQWSSPGVAAPEELPEPKFLDAIEYTGLRAEAARKAAAFIGNSARILDRADNLYDKIFAILRAGRYRAGTIAQTAFDDNREIFRIPIEKCISSGYPITFVLAAFPFKIPNPLKVSRQAPDMAELLSLLRFLEICLAIQAVYPPGASFEIVSDGAPIAPIFGVPDERAAAYRREMNKFAEKLECADRIAFHDMQALIERKESGFAEVSERLEMQLRDWWLASRDDARKRSITDGMLANIQLPMTVVRELVRIATDVHPGGSSEESLVAAIRKIRSSIQEYADRAAFKYVLLHCALRESNLLLNSYPYAIKATVHPKPRQWGPYLVNKDCRILPWQGVALRTAADWRIRYEWQMQHAGIRPVHLTGETYPFYYEADL